MLGYIIAIVILLIICILASTLCYRAYYLYYVPFYKNSYPRQLVSKAIIRPGDLILFVASVHNYVNSMLTCSFFSHVGMAVMYEGKLYISESTRQTYFPDKNGKMTRTMDQTQLFPLYTRLKYYAGYIYHLKLNRDLDPRRRARLDDVIMGLEQNPIRYPYFSESIINILGFRTNALHCFGLQYKLLRAINLLPECEHPRGFLTCSKLVCNLDQYDLPDGYKYASPVQLLYDLDCID